MEIIVLGAGAIGSLYGAKLAAHNDVTLVGRAEHAAAINFEGLRIEGIEPQIVDDGQQAVDAVQATAFDVIFLDLQMPVMDGLTACRAIRKLELTKHPFIVALTANVFQEDRDAAAAAGMDDYLSKPINLVRLREMFTTIVDSISLPA